MTTRRPLLLAAASAVLAGCTQNKPVVLDRQAMTGVKRIELPTVGMPRSPDVDVTNSISKRVAGFGLIGAISSISGSVVRGNRSDALVRMMSDQRFDPGAAFTEMLTAELHAKGFTVVPAATDPKRRFLASVASSPDYDAVLDCYVAQYGFIALNDDSDSPYRATVVVPTRLVGAGGAMLMLDQVVISAGGGLPETAAAAPVASTVASGTPADGAPAPDTLEPGTFRSFSDVEKDPAAGVDALRAAFRAAATGVVLRIT